MSSRGTAIDRVLAFYRTASPDTVRVTHQLAVEVMQDRKIGGKPAVKGAKGVRRGRKPQPAQTDSGASAAAASSGGN